MSETPPSRNASSPWAPLQMGIFRALWIATLVSNIGGWMQTVGAQWLLVSLPGAAILVALVQTADMLPDVLFAYVGGVLADIMDRRRLLIIVQGCLTLIGLALTLLTIAGQMSPALLLVFTFLLGASSAFSTPAFESMIPDLVPHAQVPSATALESININIARAIGPAIAGLLIERAGVAAVFALNTLAFAIFGLVVAFSRPSKKRISRFPEQFTAALRAGEYYVRYSPVVQRIIIRSGIFLVPASILWAELPLVATQRLGLGANGYGLLLGALGVGAVAGALSLPRLRTRFSTNGLLFAASLFFTIALLALVLIPNTAVILILLIPTGIAWIAVLSSMNTELQLFLPGWVRARGLSIYQMVLFGTQAAGAVIWGLIAGQIGLFSTFLIAAAAMALGALTLRFWPLYDVAGEDRNLAVYWPEPRMAIHPDLEAGPVLVMTTYTIAPEKELDFLDAMGFVRRSRLRTGAVQWGLYRDSEQPNQLVEFFIVPSWEEHLRQHTERLTGTDRQFEERADALSNPPSHSVHLIGVDIPNE